MAKYSVEVPFTGTMLTLVEADSEEAAIEKAMSKRMEISFPRSKDTEAMKVQFHKVVVEGARYNGLKNYVEAYKETD